MRSEDFELRIDCVGESCLATVLRSPLGRHGRRAQCTFRLPASEDPGSDPLNPRNLVVAGPRPPRRSDRELGRRLFEAAFAGSVLSAWRASIALRSEPQAWALRLRLAENPHLLAAPWELLFDPDEGGFIATERRFCRSLDAPSARRTLEGRAPLRVLAVLSCPPGVEPLQVEEEWDALRKALGGKAVIERVEPRLEAVDRALQTGRWDVLHFAGHGEVDQEGGSLILDGADQGSRTVDHLRVRTFLGHPSLQLVVLNSCEGARPGSEDAFSGLAQALVKRGVPAVVAMQQPISDRGAIELTRSFYGALAEKHTVAEALRGARRALLSSDTEGAEWAVPVLYLNGKDGRPGPGVLRRVAKIASVLAGLALLGWYGWAFGTRPVLQPPQGAAGNPPECPSPPGLDMAFVKIEPDSFQMGDDASPDSRPVHAVRITRPFCIGAYEVTREQWAKVFKGSQPSAEKRYLPEAGVEFAEAEGFVRLVQESDPAGPAVRLPTEAEWEYVARGRANSKRSLPGTGNCGGEDRFDDLAWVGQFSPNYWGVYDVYGNVSEWVSDWYGGYPFEDLPDPQGPPRGELRIRRGGSWKSGERFCNSTGRSKVDPANFSEETGLRVVREIRPSAAVR